MQRYVLGFVIAQTLSGPKVLLQLKLRGPAAIRNKWNGVGGKVEQGETPDTAMLRELTEETGIVAPIEDCCSIGAFSDDQTYTVYAYLIQITPGALAAFQQLENEPLGIFDVTAILNGTIPLPMDEQARTGLALSVTGVWPHNHRLSDAECSELYREANGQSADKHYPIYSECVFRAIRRAVQLGQDGK